MQKLPLFLLLGATIVTFDTAPAQQLPPPDVLSAIVGKLRQRPRSKLMTFAPSASHAADPVCKMQRFTMTLASGSAAARALPVLLDQTPADVTAPFTMLAVLRRVAVDADGSPRAYHPDDPNAAGVCKAEKGADGREHYSGLCALDNFASGDIQVFNGAQKLHGADLAAEWKGIWPLIRDKKLAAIELEEHVPTAPDGYYFFYRAERAASAFFKRDVVPQTWDHFPCLRDATTGYPGYFVSATTLQQQGAAQADTCVPSHFIDAEDVPYFVLPDGAFGNARLGDIVVARWKDVPADRIVYGIVADTGSPELFGEASIAFNRALMAKSDPILTGRDVLALDIHGGPVTLLILGGSKPLLNGDFSRRNIEEVGRREFARWNGDPSNATRRLDACVRQLGANR